jgi:hypothetical protein
MKLRGEDHLAADGLLDLMRGLGPVADVDRAGRPGPCENSALAAVNELITCHGDLHPFRFAYTRLGARMDADLLGSLARAW